MNRPFLTIEPVWQDNQIVEIRVTAETEHFSGRANAYSTYKALREFANALKGFPRSPTARHTFDTGAGQGSFAVSFSCAGSVGYIAVAAKIREQSQEVQLEFVAEPAAIDRFHSSLLRMCTTESGVAELEGVIA